jgi:hypothetical protein
MIGGTVAAALFISQGMQSIKEGQAALSVVSLSPTNTYDDLNADAVYSDEHEHGHTDFGHDRPPYSFYLAAAVGYLCDRDCSCCVICHLRTW